MDKLGHSSSKPEEVPSVATSKDDADSIDGMHHIRNFKVGSCKTNHLTRCIQGSGSTSWTQEKLIKNIMEALQRLLCDEKALHR